MTDLLFAGGNNHAGTYLIRCVPANGLLSLPSPATGGPMQVSGPPSFRAGYGWQTIYGTDGSKTYQEEQSDTDNGALWTVTIGLFLPGDSPQQRSSLARMAAQRFVLECQDNLGLWRRVGTKVQTLKLSYKFGIGGQLSDQRGATLSFSGVLTAPPPFVVY